MKELVIPERNNLTKKEYIEVLTKFIFTCFYGLENYDGSKQFKGAQYIDSKRLAVAFCNKIYKKRTKK